MNNQKSIDALRTILEYARTRDNLDDPMMGEIKSAVSVLDDYIAQFDN